MAQRGSMTRWCSVQRQGAVEVAEKIGAAGPRGGRPAVGRCRRRVRGPHSLIDSTRGRYGGRGVMPADHLVM